MVKRQTRKILVQNQDKGKQKIVKSATETSKRGRKTKQEILENISQAYSVGNPS